MSSAIRSENAITAQPSQSAQQLAYARAIERDGLDAILAPYVVEEVR